MSTCETPGGRTLRDAAQRLRRRRTDVATKRTRARNEPESGGQAPAKASAAGAVRRPSNGRDRETLAARTRQRAFEIYERRSALGAPGSDLDDWLRAEREVTGEE
jgi:hypothetical protein